MATAPGIDATFKGLARDYGMTNMQSGGDRAMPKVVQQQSDAGPQHTFAPGFTCTVDPSRPVCVPSQAQVKANHKLTIGQALPPNPMFKHPSTNTRIEGRHVPGKDAA